MYSGLRVALGARNAVRGRAQREDSHSRAGGEIGRAIAGSPCLPSPADAVLSRRLAGTGHPDRAANILDHDLERVVRWLTNHDVDWGAGYAALVVGGTP